MSRLFICNIILVWAHGDIFVPSEHDIKEFMFILYFLYCTVLAPSRQMAPDFLSGNREFFTEFYRVLIELKKKTNLQISSEFYVPQLT